MPDFSGGESMGTAGVVGVDTHIYFATVTPFARM